MRFEKVPTNEFDKVRDAKAGAERVIRYAERLTKVLEKLLNSEFPVEAWGTSLVMREDGRSALIDSPYGQIRAVTVPMLGRSGAEARFVFEKLTASEQGTRMYVPVWAVRINSNGAVVTDDGAEEIFSLHAMSENERDRGAVTIALSALYAAATHEGYWVEESSDFKG